MQLQVSWLSEMISQIVPTLLTRAQTAPLTEISTKVVVIQLPLLIKPLNPFALQLHLQNPSPNIYLQLLELGSPSVILLFLVVQPGPFL